MCMKDIQQASLIVLKYIHQICEEYKLEYCVFYGTLIGAIRHRGFIPWDDDIDIAMKREDYDQFLHIMKEKESDNNPFYVDHFSTSTDYPHYIMRICDKRYTVIFDNTKHKSGVFVDVYPLDDTGGDIDYWKKQVGRVDRIKKCMTLCTYKSVFYGSNLLHKLLNIPLLLYSRLKGINSFMCELDKLAQQFNGRNSGYVGVTSWERFPSQIKEEWIKELILVPFEDTQVYVPREYDKVLKAKYKNYMELPPADERVPHHNYVAYKQPLNKEMHWR